MSVTSDNGNQFRSELFKKYMNENGIHHRRTLPLHPAANGEVERHCIIMFAERQRLGKGSAFLYLFAYRTNPHSTTGVTPVLGLIGIFHI